jgi:glycosyltransferase involved in cell wall biosynthesis
VRIAYLSPSLSRAAGGIFEISRELALAISRIPEHTVNAIGLCDDWTSRDQHLWAPVKVDCFGRRGPKQFGYSPGLRDRMKSEHWDVLHLHALWMYTSWAAAKWRTRTRRPLVVSPNGMLEPWALSNSAWKKRLAGAIYENRMLRNASVIHANTQKELRDIRAFGLRSPVAIIPNGVTLPARIAQRDAGPRRLVFLGRLHPKKGLRELLAAWAQVSADDPEEWRLVIAGWDDGGHDAELRRFVEEAGIASSVDFAGPMFGVEKEQLLGEASAFILPSFSEGLPMAVLEAWAYGLPVVMTEHCNLPEGFASDAALRVTPAAASIATGLRKLMRMTDGERTAMGARGRVIVERQFSWPQIAAQMADVYRWVLGGGSPPACVDTA